MSIMRWPDIGSEASRPLPPVRSHSSVSPGSPRTRCSVTACRRKDRVVRTDLMGGANQITDHYLVALARQHRLSLATLDEPLVRAFASESGLVQLVA